VVTPNIVAPTSGFPAGCSTGFARAMPAAAAAAFVRMRADTALMPEMSTTE
jgi:hypothetical protein